MTRVTMKPRAAMLEEIAYADAITVVVGAGSGVEAGLPDWGRLVRDLLYVVGRNEGLKESELRQFARWVSKDGLPAAGATANAVLGKAFMPALRSALYGERRKQAAFSPGQTARGAVRALLEYQTSGSEIATTNYDLLIEAAAEAAVELRVASNPGDPLASAEVVSLIDETPPEPTDVVVRHLHGILRPSGRREGHVVLSEADYHLMQDAEAWQEQYFCDRLENSTCLFVGTSLSDPNLLRYLYRASGGGGHVACFARQQDGDLYQDLSQGVIAARERVGEARWHAVGVEPLLFDYFGQAAQVLYEVALCRRYEADYIPFEDRLAEWEGELGGSLLRTSDRVFRATQDDLHEILRDSLGAVIAVLSREGFELRRGERLSCALWVHQPSKGALTNWASSDRVWRDPRTLEPVPLSWSSPFVAVNGFCSGSLVSYSTAEQAATRWNHVVAAPLYIDEDQFGPNPPVEVQWGRLPVGVITFASTEQEGRSLLSRAEQVIRTVVLPQAIDSLAWLLCP